MASEILRKENQTDEREVHIGKDRVPKMTSHFETLAVKESGDRRAHWRPTKWLAPSPTVKLRRGRVQRPWEAGERSRGNRKGLRWRKSGSTEDNRRRRPLEPLELLKRGTRRLKEQVVIPPRRREYRRSITFKKTSAREEDETGIPLLD